MSNHQNDVLIETKLDAYSEFLYHLEASSLREEFYKRAGDYPEDNPATQHRPNDSGYLITIILDLYSEALSMDLEIIWGGAE